MLRIAWNCHQKILGQQKLPHLFSKSAPNMIAYFAWASGPLQCLSNQSISANNKTVLLIGQIFQWRGWENKANCYRVVLPASKKSPKMAQKIA